jgi:hypothetical protein
LNSGSEDAQAHDQRQEVEILSRIINRVYISNHPASGNRWLATAGEVIEGSYFRFGAQAESRKTTPNGRFQE